MASRFRGRDYSTLRSEIIEFLRVRLPNNWDYTNIADPVVIFAESLARIGDQLHYTIDELRRECDVATAKRASSIYSYAMREGYKMFLPRASFGTISINTTKEQDGLLHLKLNQFDEIVVNPIGETLYVANKEPIDAILHAPIDESYVESLKKYETAATPEDTDTNRKKAMTLYQSYFNDIYHHTQHVRVVLGTKTEFPFTYNDINNDSTVELPNPFIDRDLVRLSYSNGSTGIDETTGLYKYKELTYVDDVISSGFVYESFTLTPKFIGGAITLCIEFPTNYRDIFGSDINTKFKFEYINIKDSKIDPLEAYQDNAEAVTFPEGAITVVSGHEEDQEIADNGMQYRVNFGDGIKGYTEYENALVTRDNYKKFVQNYSALLTKDDYANYIKALTHSYCKVFDHGDMYKLPPVLPESANLLPRVIYILTDSNYSGRENLWNDLKERSSRSDCIIMTPFGKDPYMIVVKAECYLVGTSIASIATQIEKELVMYYDGLVGEKIPKVSMINYLVHKASDKVVRMESAIVRDSTYGTIDTTFNSVNQLDNDQVDTLFSSIKSGSDGWESPLVDPSQTDDDYKFWLRGVIYEDAEGKLYTQDELDEAVRSRGEFAVVKRYYKKYPVLTYEKYSEAINSVTQLPADEYEDFPEEFPSIYYTHNEGDPREIKEYDDLINYQIAYGELDSKSWDIADTEIYDIGNDSSNRIKYISFGYKESATSSLEATVNLDPDNTNFWTKGQDEPIKIRSRNEMDPPGVEGIIVDVQWTRPSHIYIDRVMFPFDSVIDDDERVGVKAHPVSSDGTYTSYTPAIKTDYKKHHYMVPVLSKVVVLIKSVNNNS